MDAGDADDGEEVLERFAKELSQLRGRHGTLPLAVRVVVSGRCRVHERLAADSLHWINELRATALDLSGGRAWIEQVRFATSPGVSFEDLRRGDGPLGELVRYLDEVRADEKMAAALADELDELYRKLPEDVRRDADFSDWRLPGGLDGLLNDVEPLLVGRLLDQED